MNDLARRFGRPRYLSNWRVPVTAIAAAAIMGGTAAAATAATPNPASPYVRNYGLGANVYDYPGGWPTTSLTPAGHLDDGVQVQVVCYVIGETRQGQDGLAPGHSDYYWDEIIPDANTALLDPHGDPLIVPDADVFTDPVVNLLVPACGSAAGNIGSLGAVLGSAGTTTSDPGLSDGSTGSVGGGGGNTTASDPGLSDGSTGSVGGGAGNTSSDPGSSGGSTGSDGGGAGNTTTSDPGLSAGFLSAQAS